MMRKKKTFDLLLYINSFFCLVENGHLDVTNQKKLQFELLSYDIQLKIANLAKQIDDKILNNNAINRNLQEQAMTLYKKMTLGLADTDFTEGVLSDIADIVTSAEFNGDENLKDIGRMAEATMKMVRNSVSAYVQKDLELARKVMDADDVVDELFDRIKKELVDTIAEQKGCGGDTAIDLIMITKYLERIGDHATNIAEWVEFSITGIHAGNVRI